MADHPYEQANLVVRRRGLGYYAAIPGAGIALRLDNIHESRGEVSGTLTVERTGYTEPLLGGVRFNIVAHGTRSSIAKLLSNRSNGVSWDGIVESFAAHCDALHRQGEPFEEVGSLPDTAKPTFLFRPFVLEDDVTMVYADGGVGKTTLSLAIAASVISGTTVIRGLPPNVTGNVMWLDWETNRRATDSHLKAICTGAEIPTVSLIYRRCTRPLHEMVESVAEKRDEAGVVLTIVDSVGQAMGGGKEGAAVEDTANRLFAALAQIGGTALVIDHVAKVNPDRRPYGSQYKWNNCRAAWYMRNRGGQDTDTHVILSNEKHNNTAKYPPIGLHYVWSEDRLTVVSEAAQEVVVYEQPRTRTQADDIADAILDAGHALSPGEIAVALGWGKDKLGQVRSQLSRHDKRFEQVPGGWRVKE